MAQTFALADECDAAMLRHHDLKSIPDKTLKTTILTDSATLFNFLIRNTATAEKCLMIDIKAARESYNEKIIDDSMTQDSILSRYAIGATMIIQ